jgi:hypothetical protein
VDHGESWAWPFFPNAVFITQCEYGRIREEQGGQIMVSSCHDEDRFFQKPRLKEYTIPIILSSAPQSMS